MTPEQRPDQNGFRFGDNADIVPPTPLREAAYHGVAGEVVRRIEPETEADPTALLLVSLVVFGNVIGRTAHFQISGTRHGCNLFLGLVGATSSGRKGTASGGVLSLFRIAAPDHFEHCVTSGLSSGEGLIQSVRDPPDTGLRRGGRGDPNADRGFLDKRLLVLEEEFARPLKVMVRQGNTLSPLLRIAWDGKSLRTMTKRPMVASDPHITAILQISKTELAHHLNTIETAGGLGNRILFAWVRRSKFLPDGGSLNDELLRPLAERLTRVIQFASQVGEVVRSPAADELWRDVYPRLSAERPGLYGALTARAAPQALRLAMIYALLDRNDFIQPVHLNAALEVVRFCDDSVKFIFGDRIGDPVADRILESLRDAAAMGLTRSEISELFQRNRTQNEIEKGLEILQEHGLAGWREEPTPGRSVQRWFALDPPVVTR